MPSGATNAAQLRTNGSIHGRPQHGRPQCGSRGVRDASDDGRGRCDEAPTGGWRSCTHALEAVTRIRRRAREGRGACDVQRRARAGREVQAITLIIVVRGAPAARLTRDGRRCGPRRPHRSGQANARQLGAVHLMTHRGRQGIGVLNLGHPIVDAAEHVSPHRPCVERHDAARRAHPP